MLAEARQQGPDLKMETTLWSGFGADNQVSVAAAAAAWMRCNILQPSSYLSIAGMYYVLLYPVFTTKCTPNGMKLGIRFNYAIRLVCQLFIDELLFKWEFYLG